MININIEGEKVTITERATLASLLPVDAYGLERNGKVEVIVCKDQVFPDFEDIAKQSLYVAGIVTADPNGNIEALTDGISFNGLVWDSELWDYKGIYLDGVHIEELDKKAGIKVFFGRC